MDLLIICIIVIVCFLSIIIPNLSVIINLLISTVLNRVWIPSILYRLFPYICFIIFILTVFTLTFIFPYSPIIVSIATYSLGIYASVIIFKRWISNNKTDSVNLKKEYFE